MESLIGEHTVWATVIRETSTTDDDGVRLKTVAYLTSDEPSVLLSFYLMFHRWGRSAVRRNRRQSSEWVPFVFIM
jgi:hypothetical protein